MPFANASSAICSSVRPRTDRSSPSLGRDAAAPDGEYERVPLGRPDQDRRDRTARDEVGHAAVGYEPAAADHDQVIRGVLHLRHQMAGDQHRPALGRQRAHQRPDPHDALRIEAVDRLVEHEDLRIAEQGGGDAEPLAHAEREPLAPLARDLREADDAQDLVDPAPADAVGLGQAEQVATCGPAPVHGPRVQQRADRAHRPPQIRVRDPADRDAPGGRAIQAEDHPHRRRSAGPFGPRNPVTRPGLTVKLSSLTATVGP